MPTTLPTCENILLISDEHASFNGQNGIFQEISSDDGISGLAIINTGSISIDGQEITGDFLLVTSEPMFIQNQELSGEAISDGAIITIDDGISLSGPEVVGTFGATDFFTCDGFFL